MLHVCTEPRYSHAEHAVVFEAERGRVGSSVPVHVCACGAVAVGPAVPQHWHAPGHTPWDVSPLRGDTWP